MRYPLAKYSEKRVTNYPLTKDELCILAKSWFEQSLDASVFCCLAGQVGSTELRIWDYADDRLARIVKILGRKELDQLRKEAEKVMRERVGEHYWRAFQERRPILQEEANARQNESMTFVPDE
jgi:hypothetical protein